MEKILEMEEEYETTKRSLINLDLIKHEKIRAKDVGLLDIQE